MGLSVGVCRVCWVWTLWCAMSSGAMSRYASVGDVSCGGDMELCGDDTVLSDAVSGCMCDIDWASGGGDTAVSDVETVVSGAIRGGLCYIDRASGGGDTAVSDVETVVSGAIRGGLCYIDRVSGGGDTDVSGVATVVSGAVIVCLCDIDNVSPGAIVVRVGKMSLSGGGDAVVMGVDEPMCGVSSVMTAGELDVCGCGSLVSDETGDVSLMTLLRVVITHCCLTRFVSVAVCRWLVSPWCATLEYHGVVEETLRLWLYQEWLNLFGWTRSSAQTVPCGPSHHR